MRILVYQDVPPPATENWTKVPLEQAIDGLPGTDEPIERIFAGHVLEHVDKELVPSVLDSWRSHPQVTAGTLLVIVGPDAPRTHRMLKLGEITQERHDEILSDGLWESNGGEVYHMARRVGWGVVHPYNLGLLKLDQWPVASLHKWQFGALCRANK